MSYVRYEREGPVVTVTLDRPERLNAIGHEMSEELAETWIRFRDDAEARVAILTGAGRAFCAGRDLKEIAETVSSARFEHAVPDIYGTGALEKPVIAAIHGYALAGGLLLAMGADLRIASESAMLGMPQGHFGIYASPLPFVSALVPTSFILELFLTGEPVTAQRAYDVGLINRVVPDDQLIVEARRLAETIATFSPLAVRTTKQSLVAAVEPTEAAKATVDEGYAAAGASPEVIDQTAAFAERRLRPLSDRQGE